MNPTQPHIPTLRKWRWIAGITAALAVLPEGFVIWFMGMVTIGILTDPASSSNFIESIWTLITLAAYLLAALGTLGVIVCLINPSFRLWKATILALWTSLWVMPTLMVMASFYLVVNRMYGNEWKGIGEAVGILFGYMLPGLQCVLCIIMLLAMKKLQPENL
jgi:hypothetical protein